MTRLAKLIVFLGYLRYTHGSASCKSSDGKDVDWFIIYKVPKLTRNKYPIETGGTEFFYMDTNSPSFSYIEKDITKNIQNPLYETLKTLYDQSPDIVSYAMYNDQPPTVKAAARSYAHSKGVLAFDNNTGFWIVSSVPKFPSPVQKGFNLSISQTKYGQTILCVTVANTAENSLKFKSVFNTTNPYIYDCKNFNINIGNPMDTVTISLKTSGNVQLEILAKSSSFGQDIYDKLISPKLADPLLVQTWRPDLSETALVSNVTDACFFNKIEFSSRVDHSKWAVTKNKPLICIGDINRTKTQAKRGGLSLCLKNADAAKEFRELHNRCAINNKQMPVQRTCPNPKRAKISP